MKRYFHHIEKYIARWTTRIKEISQPLLRWIHGIYLRVNAYYQTHPKARRLTLIFGPPLFVMMILLLVVWIEIPAVRELKNIRNQVATEVYSADSVLLGRYFIQDRTEVKYEEIAPCVVDALVATEDVRFYEHEGVDFLSLGRVLVKSILLQDESSGGGSTLTQQLAKNLYPRKNYWLFSMVINKLRELITANRLEAIYSKNELLTLYLNTVPFPDNTYGLHAAANRFFSTSTDSLSLTQAAVLVGSLKATHTYNPRLFPDRSLHRRNTVLSQMVKYKYLDSLLADSLKSEPLVLKYNRTTHHQGLAPYFREYVKIILQGWCEQHGYNLYTDGLKVYTTIDSKMQRHAEYALKKQMTALQQLFFDHWGAERPWKGNEEILDEAIKRSSRYKRLEEKGMMHEDIIKELQKPIPMRLFTWHGVREEVLSPIDSIIHHLQFLNAGFLAMDVHTGGIRAWVGGIDHDFFQYDHVKVTTKRQVGSIFKPIVYAAALEKGILPCEWISASQQTYIDDEGEKWTPKNMQNDYRVWYSMRGGLAYSVNTVAVKLIDKAGVKKTIDMAHKMGITSELPTVPSIALGSSSISLIEMVGAYGSFAKEGVSSNPYFISSIIDATGRAYHLKIDSAERIMSKETALLVREMLTGVVREGTAARIRYQYGVYSELAGKTGTTQANADGWFMGFTPDLVVGSWVGADDPRIRFRSSQLGLGSHTALPIAGYFLSQLYKDKDFKALARTRFSPLPPKTAQKLGCDLYEIDDELLVEISRMIYVRDSTLQADSLAQIADETFLEKILKRKLRMEAEQRERDSMLLQETNLQDIGG